MADNKDPSQADVVSEETAQADGVEAERPVTEIDAAEADSQPAEPTSGDSELTEVERLEAEIETLQQQLGEANDRAMRALAEEQNARRRAAQDVEKAHKFALEKFSSELLTVADNFERALENLQGDDEAIVNAREGLELTHKSLLSTFGKFDVQLVDPESAPFDPNLHQAISMVPNPDVEPNTVLNVVQKGYTLNGRLLRPAMVVVSTAG